MKVRTDVLLKGKEVTLAGVGTIEVSEDGIIEVPVELGKNLVANLGWEDVDDELADTDSEESGLDDNQGNSDETGSDDTDLGDDSTGEDDEDEEDADSLDLSTLKKDELTELAKEAELPEEEWKTLKKDELINYLTSKL